MKYSLTSPRATLHLVTAVFLVAFASLSWGRYTGGLSKQRLRRTVDSSGHGGVRMSRCPYASKLRDALQGGHVLPHLSENSGARSKFQEDVPLKALKASVKCATNVNCDPDKPFREPDGTCNNLAHPHWGSAGSCMRRELPSAYNDGVYSVRLSVSGDPLPSARLVSMTIHPQKRAHDRHLTNIGVMFGQLVTHDISLAGPALLQQLETDFGPGPNPSCLQGPDCMPIEVPENDDFYTQFNVTKIGMMRTYPCNKCRNGGQKTMHMAGPVDQLNQQTSYADLSQVYGYNSQVTTAVRKFRSGLMLTKDIGGAEYIVDNLLPYADNCSLPEQNAFCSRAGDVRANQQAGILSMQTLWMREHNRIARQLTCINPHWNDERLFQVTKRILEGRYQHILFSEWLPWQLGQKVMEEYDLSVHNRGYTSYDDTLDATLSNEFSSAHFRYAHTNVPGGYWRIDQKGQNLTILKLKDAYFVPLNDSYHPVDDVLRGSVEQPMEPFNRFADHGVTHYLFRKPWLPYGDDLFAIDIQRARDHGVRPYVDWVQECQNITITNFDDLSQVMAAETAQLYQQVYEDVRDIDLVSGALSETRLDGAELGATFACGVARQFRLLKYADRFYYEHANQSGSFNEDQLATVRKTTLTKILCENVSRMDTVATNRNAFLRPTNEDDTVMCSDLPDMDLTKWEEEHESGEHSSEANCSTMPTK
ncbi:salivary peroxidase/catechol oxidase-like isoform X2 [Dermacentor albipictus]|uniref:salivary peroxidase/catechol oxidase-like isoform X2 n=1 Tax=Dermacentor albipictus TaxID=60249 RepID=UPI0031FD2E0D